MQEVGGEMVSDVKRAEDGQDLVSAEAAWIRNKVQGSQKTTRIRGICYCEGGMNGQIQKTRRMKIYISNS